MEIFFDTVLLKNFVTTAKHIHSSGDGYMPILDNIAIGTGTDKKPKLTFTNLETTINFGSLEEFSDDAVTVNLKTFADCIKTQTGFIVTITADKFFLTLSNESVKLPVVDISEYPSFKNMIQGSNISETHPLPKDYRSYFTALLTTVSKEQNRQMLCGVHFDPVGEMVSTDGHRCTRTEGPKVSKPFILPTGTIKAITKSKFSFQGIETKPEIHSKDAPAFVLFHGDDGVSIGARTIDAEFPDYKQVCPSSYDYKMEEISPKLLKAAITKLKAVVVRDEGKGKARLVRFTISENALLLHGSSPEKGECKVSLPCRYFGPELKFGMNMNYIEDFLSTLEKTESLAVEFSKNVLGVFLFRGTLSDHSTIIAPFKLAD